MRIEIKKKRKIEWQWSDKGTNGVRLCQSHTGTYPTKSGSLKMLPSLNGYLND